jgi:hypothetical protein
MRGTRQEGGGGYFCFGQPREVEGEKSRRGGGGWDEGGVERGKILRGEGCEDSGAGRDGIGLRKLIFDGVC